MKKLFLLLSILGICELQAQTGYTLSSPSGRLRTTVAAGEELTYDLALDGRTVMEPSALALELDDGTVWGRNPRVKRARRTSVDTTHPSPLYRSAEVHDRYNALILEMKGGWAVEFRAYDDGVGYRFVSSVRKPFHIMNERVEYRFPHDFEATVPYVKTGADGNWESQYHNSFENTYTTAPLSGLNPGRLAFLPLSVAAGDGIRVCITETDLIDYPGLYLCNSDGDTALEGKFAPRPASVVPGGYNNIQYRVERAADHIAEVPEPRTFPWRIAVVGTDVEVAASDLSYLMATPSRIDDISWIRPGKVAWDWWNDWNISDVDFRAGINTPTYKYYIDFAAGRGIEYVILDDGWAAEKGEDLMQVNPEIDLPEIVGYAARKGVGIILWAGYRAFDRDMERVCAHYAAMGVKGFKVDFMDRDDQLATAFNHRVAETAARHRLVLDLHGTHKPAGLNRTWPNVLNFEGVHGLEQMKWSPASVDQIRYDATIPFIRQVSGPMDYTQGAMRNAARSAYRPCYSEPMSQGTRCHQLALYMVLDSPLNMLCDSPTNYLREAECTDFIAKIPTVWDETRILEGRQGEYIVTARRKGSVWYVGGITDWTPREVEVDLTELGGGAAAVELFADGINADRKGTDFRKSRMNAARKLKIRMAPGGGFALRAEF